jgi:hypothetical protein
VRAALKDAEFSEQDISFADDRSPQALWTKITALHDHSFKRWQSEEQRRFAAFYHQHRTDFQTLAVLAAFYPNNMHASTLTQNWQPPSKPARTQPEDSERRQYFGSARERQAVIPGPAVRGPDTQDLWLAT